MNWKWLLIWVIGGTIISHVFGIESKVFGGLMVLSAFCAIMGSFLRDIGK